ncbi:hypothetical protein EYV94_17530 [Puteibacter caeruleilacunae]|nr:hypothetical protein EYV94_17530 [Puteibacter caeruleilacunae]
MKYCALLLLLFLCLQSQAQQQDTIPARTSSKRTTSLIDLRDVWESKTNYFETKFKGHLSGVHLGFVDLIETSYSMYSEEDNDFLDPKTPRSTSLSIYPVQFNIGLQRYRNMIGIVTAPGVEFQTLHFDKDRSIVEDEDGILQPITLDYHKNIKSKLSISSVSIPVLLEFQIPIGSQQNRLFISGGIVGKCRIDAHTKIKFKKNEHTRQKLKTTDDFNLKRFNYTYMLRIGYRSFKFFAEYTPENIIKTNQGPIVHPVTVGLTLMSW